MAVDRPSLGNLPRRGPAIQTTPSALRPPSTCTVAAPPASRNPAPTLKFAPSAASHPPAQIQCAARGKTNAAKHCRRRATGREPPAIRARAPGDAGAAMATARNSKSNASCACGAAAAKTAEQETARGRAHSRAFRPHEAPLLPIPAIPANDAPTKAKTMAATATRPDFPASPATAERDRPRPVLMSATPAMASGRKQQQRQRQRKDSVAHCGNRRRNHRAIGFMGGPPPAVAHVAAHRDHQAHCLDGQPAHHKRRAPPGIGKQDQRG